MRIAVLSSVLLCVSSLAAPPGKPVRVEITRDTWVSAVGQEADFNTGGSSRLKLKGVQEFSIVDIDPKPLTGQVIAAAELHVHLASPDPLRRVTVSSLATDWTEGTSNSYQLQKGSASFHWARQDEQPWAWPGSDITAVMCGQGGTIWRFADATAPDKNGWQTIAVDPRVVGARIAGVSHGFVLMDDVGSEYERNGEQFKWKLMLNRFINSHEQSNAKPYFIAYVAGEDREPPEAPKLEPVAAIPLPPGETMVNIGIPKDHGSSGTVGLLARFSVGRAFDWETALPVPQYLVPAVPASGQGVGQMHLRDLALPPGARFTIGVRAVDGAGNESSVAITALTAFAGPATIELKPAPTKPFAAAGPLPRVGGVDVAIVDALDKLNPSTGTLLGERSKDYLSTNHLWNAADRTLRLFAAKSEFVDFQILLTGASPQIRAAVTFEDGVKAEVFRFRHVKTKAGLLPDPLVPLDGPLSIPATDETIGDQKAASLLADVYIPRDARPGLHTGTLKLTAGGESLSIKIELHVWDFTLPDELSFIPEMNCYGLPDAQEIAYYRLAHAHRTNLNRLGYSWRGIPNDGCAPRWDGRQFQWDNYDRRFGPLLDGSAFADLPRGAVPVDTFYLPLNENWPIDINAHFKGGYWADEAFDPEYEKGFTAACAAFAQHFRERKWNQTFCQFYLNNKVYYKANSWSKSSAPWILDEPVNAQDFWALRYYGKLFHAGIDPVRGDVKMAFRCDISYPQWQRDMLDGILDIDVCGGAFRQYRRAVLDRKQRTGEITYNYGSSNNIEDSNVQPAGWCIDTWCLGGDGVLPWQTVGNEKSWVEGDALSLFYPSLPGGRGPIPSVRLKAYRRGQQDVEYLTMLTQITGQPRFAVAETVRQMLKLSASVSKRNADDAGLVGYGSLDPAALWDLRVRVGSMLDAAKPAAKRKLIDLKTPPRDMAALPETGLVKAP